MKNLILAGILAVVSSLGCVVSTAYADPPVVVKHYTGCVSVCDEYGCREVCSQYYYTPEGYMVYWDAHFGIWVHPHGYWRGGHWYGGRVPGWYGYHHGSYYWRGGHGSHGGHGHRR